MRADSMINNRAGLSGGRKKFNVNFIVKASVFFAPKRRNMNDSSQTNTTGRLTPCLYKRIDKTTYLVEVYFSDTSTQSVKDKLKRVILHDLEYGKQGRARKSDEK